MSRPDGTPEVFGDGDITLVVNSEKACLYVGTVQVEFLDGVVVEIESKSKPVVSVRFPRDENSQMRVEENARLLRALPWVKVLQ